MPAIEYEIPYYYEATYVPPRKRNSVTGTFGGAMTVEVESVSSDDAPVVLSVTVKDTFRETTTHYRSYDGAFYTDPFRDHFVLLESVPLERLHDFPGGVVSAFENGTLTAEPTGHIQHVEGNWNTDRLPAIIEARKEEIRQGVANRIFVDGVLLQKTELPSLSATIEYGFPHRITVATGGLSSEWRTHGMRFSVGDYDSAVAWADDRLVREGGDGSVRLRVEVAVYRPDLMPEGTLLASEACDIGRTLLAHDFKLQDEADETIDDWKVCRRATEECLSDPDDDKITAMLDAWMTFYRNLEPIKNARHERFSSSYSLDRDVHHNMLAGVHTLWNDRPILADEATLSRTSLPSR